MRVLLLIALLAIPASVASPAASTPLYSEPALSEPVISAPAPKKPVINPNPSARAALGLCPPTAAQMAADRARKNGGLGLLHKLTDLPPANEYIAVYRRDADGCEDPIVVKYGVGRR